MQKLEVEFTHKNTRFLIKISILIKKIFRISPYICCFSLVIGIIDILLKGKMPAYVRPVSLVIFCLSCLMFFLSFLLEYIFLFLWKCPICKGKFSWYKTTLGYLGEEGNSLINKSVKDICDCKDKKIPLFQYQKSNLLIPQKCPHCGEIIWKKSDGHS